MNYRAVIGLGSNINPEENIKKAKLAIAERFEVIAESKFIKTKPIGYTKQDDFINGAIYMSTNLSITQLIQALKKLEDQLGRERSVYKFGPRTIDLDLVVYDNKVLDKDFYERDFLKNSVLELIPNLEY